MYSWYSPRLCSISLTNYWKAFKCVIHNDWSYTARAQICARVGASQRPPALRICKSERRAHQEPISHWRPTAHSVKVKDESHAAFSRPTSPRVCANGRSALKTRGVSAISSAPAFMNERATWHPTPRTCTRKVHRQQRKCTVMHRERVSSCGSNFKKAALLNKITKRTHALNQINIYIGVKCTQLSSFCAHLWNFASRAIQSYICICQLSYCSL